MRVVTNIEQESAGRHAMKGFAIGAAQWASVGVFASGLLYAFTPWYKRQHTVNKVNKEIERYRKSERVKERTSESYLLRQFCSFIL